MKTIMYLSAGVYALMSAPAWADEAATDVDTLVVTANRVEQRLDRVGGQISVVDQADLEAQQTLVVTDILRRLPGVSLSRNGGVGGATQLRIRGGETGHTVVLIDGVKLNDPSAIDSSYNAANLLVGDVARIEVLRGAQSVLWGSQAIGGVINIIGAEPNAPFEAQGKAEAGSAGTFDAHLAAGGKSDRSLWRVAGGYYTTDGVSSFNRARGGREDDGYENWGVSGKGRIELTDQLSLDLRSVYSRGQVQIDGFPPPNFTFGDTPEYSTTKDLVAYVGLNLDLMDGRLSNRIALGYTDTKRSSVNPAQAPNPVTFDAAGRNRRLDYQGTFKAADALSLVFGAESERSRFRTASPSVTTPNPTPGRRKASLDGVYGQVSGRPVESLTLTAGLRRDEQGDFGGHTVGEASAAWAIADTVVRASWGEGFKAPSLFQLGSDFGNLNLNPETARTWDAGLERRFAQGRIMLSAAYFERRTTNQIDFVSCFGVVLPMCFGPGRALRAGYYDNIASSQAHGFELQVEATPIDGLDVAANYTRTVSTNRSAGANFGNWLPRRPRNQANLDVSYVWPFDLTTGVAATYSGQSFDDLPNRNLTKGYVLWDLRASYPVTEAIEVYGRVENLFDVSYETIRNYGQPGRAAYAGLRARF